jgi:hypothetical protein
MLFCSSIQPLLVATWRSCWPAPGQVTAAQATTLARQHVAQPMNVTQGELPWIKCKQQEVGRCGWIARKTLKTLTTDATARSSPYTFANDTHSTSKRLEMQRVRSVGTRAHYTARTGGQAGRDAPRHTHGCSHGYLPCMMVSVRLAPACMTRLSQPGCNPCAICEACERLAPALRIPVLCRGG